ncbi:MAG TPA: hypothetical protein VK167_10470 [Flavipsychrobacter sp.]|nr:hypothetical protein [Flavipsychrobacter sp.]
MLTAARILKITTTALPHSSTYDEWCQRRESFIVVMAVRQQPTNQQVNESTNQLFH